MNQDKHNNSQNNERQAMKYLLGEMPEQEQEQFEARYFADDALFEQVAIAKEELIDRYVRGQLDARTQQQLENRLDQSPPLRQDIAFARSLHRAISESPSKVKAATVASHNQSWLSPFLPRAWAWAALLFVIGIGGLGWLWRENRRLRMELEGFRAEQTAQSLREKELREQIAELRGQKLSAPPPDARPGQSPSPAPPGDGVFFAINLTATVRSGEKSETFSLPAKTGSVRLRIFLNFQPQPLSCRVTLRTIDGQQIARRAARAEYKNDGYIVETDLPAALFKTGEYIAAVNAVGTDRQTIEREYGFRVER